jgi:riboflavin biosynthesis pyrimidine reductase
MKGLSVEEKIRLPPEARIPNRHPTRPTVEQYQAVVWERWRQVLYHWRNGEKIICHDEQKYDLHVVLRILPPKASIKEILERGGNTLNYSSNITHIKIEALRQNLWVFLDPAAYLTH